LTPIFARRFRPDADNQAAPKPMLLEFADDLKPVDDRRIRRCLF